MGNLSLHHKTKFIILDAELCVCFGVVSDLDLLFSIKLTAILIRFKTRIEGDDLVAIPCVQWRLLAWLGW